MTSVAATADVHEVGALRLPDCAIQHAIRYVRALEGDPLYLRGEVADALDVSPATLRRLAATHPRLMSTSTVARGGVSLAVYDMAGVARLHAYLALHRRRGGRPRLWTNDERRARRTAYSALGYRRRRASALRVAGRDAEADRVEHEADALATALRQAHTSRSAAPIRDTAWAGGE